jgi:hypothetical protein
METIRLEHFTITPTVIGVTDWLDHGNPARPVRACRIARSSRR